MSLDEAIAAIPILLDEVRALRREFREFKEAKRERPRKFYKVPEAAERLNVSVSTVRRYVRDRRLRRSLGSRHVLIPVEDVEKFSEKVTLPA